MNARSWSERELNLLKTWFDEGVPDDIIADRLNRTHVSVKVKRKRIGLTGERNARRLSAAARNAMGPRFKGKEHPSWKGGRRISSRGYVEVLMRNHPRARKNGYVFEHILVAEQKIGRPLLPDEEVHHIDKNKQNNSPDNLLVVRKTDHHLYHPEHYENRKTGKEIECCICKKKFYVKRAALAKRQTCSKECVKIYFRMLYTGKPRDHKPTLADRMEAFR